jgi:hypothetical protein
MADRWVCRSCWASNEDKWDKCFRCKVPRGAQAAPGSSADPLAAGAPAAAQTERPLWQRLPMRFAWVGVVAVVGIVGAVTAASRDDSGHIVGAGTLDIVDVRVGDCFDLNDGPDVEEVGEVRAIPCTEPHTFEAYFATDLAAGDYPSRSALDAQVEAACLPSFEPYVGRDYETSELYVTTFEPTPAGWNDGDRGILCVLSTFEAATPLTASVRDSGR